MLFEDKVNRGGVCETLWGVGLDILFGNLYIQIPSEN
jgi:hypothetical protein